MPQALRHHHLKSVLVSNADKFQNAQAVLSDYRVHGEVLWSRFDAESDQLWYYRSES